MRIDAHQHFWRYDPAKYAWMDERMQVLKRDYLPADLALELVANGLGGSIAVQARHDEAETADLLQLADENDFIRGVVGWVALRPPDVSEHLATLARNPRFCGVRHVVQDEPDDEFLLDDDFCRGIAALGMSRRLIYDLLIYPRQLPAAVRFVERFAQQAFVLDHIAKPAVGTDHSSPEFTHWEEHVRALARHPLLSCKVSGLVTEAPWNEWKADDFRPYLDVIFDAFGEDRLMFGSDWPVCLLSAADYAAVHRLILDYTNDLSVGARDKIFGLNAARIYGLPD